MEKKELPQLEKLYQRGLENGVKDLKILDSKQIKEVEPYCEVSIPSPEFLKLKFHSTRAFFPLYANNIIITLFSVEMLFI